ncbi:hypothetical protein SAMN02745181_1767 [Rubritalea squalenifaciens DSM 18772]|uniref:Uncharacterized protein n=1 Tax=Rubritalea squalenifaciens DSM 18772 TaxID=1123071 RepID=A0A1M6IDB5_9BACT|nr:hypothetical protein SAMN02745181_1767 [Rubritalea squalenifaciens DSM 18772]
MLLLLVCYTPLKIAVVKNDYSANESSAFPSIILIVKAWLPSRASPIDQQQRLTSEFHNLFT